LKGVAGLNTSPAALSAYVAEWFRRALPFVKTKDFAETELAFYDAWTNAEVPLADEQFRATVEAALASPDPAWLADVYLPAAGIRLVKVCAALQANAGDKPFFLSARMAGAVAGVDPTHANRLMHRLEKAGYLVEVEKGTRVSGRATDWRFIEPPTVEPRGDDTGSAAAAYGPPTTAA
jgi:hypothetical protein